VAVSFIGGGNFFLEESDGQQSHQYQQNKQDFAL
jgi:hypothetical protein